tara:strand:+ start:3531 stop:4037 length:507 start_codon:yes stop_codon:yes gene_type:complete
MATEYERIDALFKAVAGLLSPHLDSCESTITDFDDGDLSDMVTNIEDSQNEISDLGDRIDTIENDVITTDNIGEYIMSDELIDEIDDRVREKFNDDINEKISDFFQYEGGGDLITEAIDDDIASMVRREVEAQMSPERLVKQFIEGLTEAINGNKDGRYTVTIRDEVA